MSKPKNARSTVSSASRALVAANLQLARGVFQFSQDELGKHCGLNRTHISAIERQELNVGLDTLQKIAEAFRVPAFVMLMPASDAEGVLTDAWSTSPARLR